jgi:hypothetical protein
MTVCGKHGKTIKLFSHSSHSPWKSLRRFPHSHRHDYDDHEYLSKPVKTKTRRNDAQYHYPGGPNQMVKVGHAGIANSAEYTQVPTTQSQILSSTEQGMITHVSGKIISLISAFRTTRTTGPSTSRRLTFTVVQNSRGRSENSISLKKVFNRD